jgi:CPA2 family monovalent cation:H+ antiporter-2
MLLATSNDVALTLLELGVVVLALALLARVAERFSLSPIPLYLLAGLGVGQGGVVHLDFSEDFIRVGADIGVVLLLLALGAEYSADDLRVGLRQGWRAGVVDAVANFTPGFAAGLLLGWGGTGAVLLGGITYVSSSGVAAKLLADLGRVGNRETPVVLSILVMEDLTMAAYLPLVAVIVAGGSVLAGIVSVTTAIGLVAIVLAIALRHGVRVSGWVSSPSDEVLLLSVLGTTLVVAGLAERFHVSAAVGAFLVGVALSGSVSKRVSALIRPLRDLFAATFFLFFALQVDPAELPSALTVAITLAVVTTATKFASGWWAAARAGIGRRGRARTGTTLVARGEFSIVIAGLAAGASPTDLPAVAAAYVLILAVSGPVLARYADALVEREPRAPARD